MTKKDLFRILIKIFGLYSLIVALFTVFPSQLSFVLFDLEIWGILYILIILVFIMLIFYLLILFPDKIISMLKLDRGFDDERIDFKALGIDPIVKTAILVIGGLILLDSIPSFLSQSYMAFKSDVTGQEIEIAYQIGWATEFVKIVIGYLLLTQYQWIANWFTRVNQSSDENQ
jgi:hypothetical protein